MTSNIVNNAKDEHKSPLWIGIVLIALGAIGIALPNISTIIVETWISLLLVSAGGAKLVYAFQTRDRGGFILKLLLSILYIATGVGLFVYPLSGVVTLTLLLPSFFCCAIALANCCKLLLLISNNFHQCLAKF